MITIMLLKMKVIRYDDEEEVENEDKDDNEEGDDN